MSQSLTILLSQTKKDWIHTVYGELNEILPPDVAEPLGEYVTLTHYVNANHMHDITTGKSVTDILHLLNQTPIDLYSKKQAAFETATYSSEFVAAHTCIEQIIDLQCTLWYFGVSICHKSSMFADNKTVVDSSTTPHSKLHKWHTILSFHHVHEAITSVMVTFYYLLGTIIPADILSKHWGYTRFKECTSHCCFGKEILPANQG